MVGRNASSVRQCPQDNENTSVTGARKSDVIAVGNRENCFPSIGCFDSEQPESNNRVNNGSSKHLDRLFIKNS
jgi:hypothetical protein